MLDEYMLIMLLNKIYSVYVSEDLGDFFRGGFVGIWGFCVGFVEGFEK